MCLGALRLIEAGRLATSALVRQDTDFHVFFDAAAKLEDRQIFVAEMSQEFRKRPRLLG
jgi:hypothetical protein